LRDITPDLAVNIDEMARKIFDGQQLMEPSKKDVVEQEKAALIDYGLQLSHQLGGQLEPSDLEVTVARVLDAEPNFEDIESMRAAFAEVTNAVSDALGGVSIDPMVAAQVRSVATLDAAIGPLGSLNATENSGNSSSSVNFNAPSSILDVEIVAIYW
jgi:hypothetical protein